MTARIFDWSATGSSGDALTINYTPAKRAYVASRAVARLWSSTRRAQGPNRRIIAVGFTDGLGNTEVHQEQSGQVHASHLKATR